MKKLLGMLSAVVLMFTFSSIGNTNIVSAQENESSGYLTETQIQEFNDILEELRQEANIKLAKNENDFTVSSNVSFQKEPISLVFKSNDLIESNNTRAAASASKEYSATIANTAGFNFSHELFGKFIYSGGKITSHTKDANLSGPLYSKTQSISSVELDPSVVRVTSTGKFKALKYAPVEYSTKIVVELYGSGTYTIITASVS